jgi:hypothetical protein
VEPRDVIVQAGGYGEHQFSAVDSQAVDSKLLTLKLEPGAGRELKLSMKRYANRPSLEQPW